MLAWRRVPPFESRRIGARPGQFVAPRTRHAYHWSRKLDEDEIEIPDDLHDRIDALLRENPEKSWDDVVAEIAYEAIDADGTDGSAP